LVDRGKKTNALKWVNVRTIQPRGPAADMVATGEAGTRLHGVNNEKWKKKRPGDAMAPGDAWTTEALKGKRRGVGVWGTFWRGILISKIKENKTERLQGAVVE